jgi:N-acetylglucosaminyl-diphospho-decaprenol L-rhamnosyltransferase
MSSSKCRVGVAIANYNSGPLLAKCLTSLQRGAGKWILPPVVADSRSIDESIALAVQACPTVRVCETLPDPGFAVATNQAASLAGGQLILILNTDCFIRSGMERMVSFMLVNPDVAAVGPRLYNPDGTYQPSCGNLPELRNLLRHYFPLTRFVPVHGGSKPNLLDPYSISRARVVGWIMGSCMLVRRDVWDQTGGFDEGYYLYSEEVDWCWRAAVAGRKVVYFPGADAIHLGGASTRGDGALGGRLPYEHEKSALRLMRKMGRSGATGTLRAFQAASACLLLLAHGLAAAAGREDKTQWARRLSVTRSILDLTLHYGRVAKGEAPLGGVHRPSGPAPPGLGS